jgi:hypothetical protein
MLKKAIALLLVSALTLAIFCPTPALANPDNEKDASMTAKVKSGVSQIGTGREARVKLTLRDKTRLVGFISEANDEYFVVTHLKTGAETQVAYPDVTQVQGNNLSTRTKVIIGVSIVAAVVIVLWITRGAFCDGC